MGTNILPLTTGITLAMFGGASLVGLMIKRDAMLGYGKVLTGSMLGLIGLNIFGLIASKYGGYHIFA